MIVSFFFMRIKCDNGCKIICSFTQRVKHLPVMWENQVQPLGWEDPLEKGQTTPVFLLGESHEQRSQVGYSPQGHKESVMTERLHFLSLYKMIINMLSVLLQLN